MNVLKYSLSSSSFFFSTDCIFTMLFFFSNDQQGCTLLEKLTLNLEEM